MTLKKLKQLGVGGFGIVDLVVDVKGNQYARKTFSLHQPLSKELAENVRKRFVREAKVQAGLSHKNIVPVLGGDLDGDQPFYLMPVAVATLAVDLDKDRTLSRKFMSAISDIAAALEELHSLEIYHRDLKPQNVLRLNDGATEYYAISDFGLISQKDLTLSKLTTTGMAKGSDYYTAPEITANLRRASAQSDIFSLGCILHDMVGQKDRVPCQEIKDDGDYGQILLSSTRNDPKRRFKSVRSFLDALVSIDPSAAKIESKEASKFALFLDSENPFTATFCNELVEYVEDNVGTSDSKALLMKLSLERIQEICDKFPDQAARLGSAFADWVSSEGFNFETCDGIANRLEGFIKSSSLNVKVEGLLAMLAMGTSHNRWYVERKFFSMCGPELDELSAKRLAVEFHAAGEDICRQIAHLEQSISVHRNSFHPLLIKALGQVCP